MAGARSSRDVAPRAWRPGVGGVILVAVTASIALAGCTTTAASRPARSTDHGTSAAKYGSLPAFLPPESFDTDQVLIGTAARPALTTEGDAVRFGSGAGAAIVTVSGPEVPGEGLPYQAAATTCTWTIKIRAGSHSVPIALDDFSAIDHLGMTYQLSFVPGQSTPPTVVAPHATVEFELRAVMVVGEGLILWAPDGDHPVAKWDFEVEND